MRNLVSCLFVTVMKGKVFSLFAVAIGLPLTGSLVGEEETATSAYTKGEMLYALEIKPLFAEKCNACHGDEPDKIKGDFDMRSREAMLKGGEYFAEEVLMPGEGEDSFLYILTTRTEEDYEMPPKEADALTEEEQWAIRDWISEGAPWLEDDVVLAIQDQYAEGVKMATSGGLSDDWTNRRYEKEDVWAYQPITRPDLPTDLSRDEVIDYFINQKLDSIGLPPADMASPVELARRASYNLLGLPPEVETVRQFEAASAEDQDAAWAAHVEDLLSSPHYGEHWGRHWLDVVRYADTSGFANDYERPNAWRYRDYVVRSFNDDKPYDLFVKEQIAGDELYQRESSEGLVATGFLRMGAWEQTAMSNATETRQLFLDDVTDTVGQVFLAHALQCAKCHDHKFDPIPTQDYYSFQAIFSATQFSEPEAPWASHEVQKGMEEDKRLLETQYASAVARLDELNQKKREREKTWFAERNLPYTSVAEAKKAGADPAQIPQEEEIVMPEEGGLYRILRKWRSRYNWEKDRYKPFAYSVHNGGTVLHKSVGKRLPKPKKPLEVGEIEQTAILDGGDLNSPSTPVAPAVLSAVPGGQSFELPTGPEGRRLALAKWIVSDDNTLTARVMVNRIWGYHFGVPLAGNPNNFGATGKKPTHPELLDWLALEFQKNGWSVKEMHRLIMNTDVYRRSARHPDQQALQEKDPLMESLAQFHPRRLAAEELRDSMLAISGELNRAVGGIPVRPDINMEAALQPRMIMGTYAPSYVPSPRPEQRNRRTIYAHKARGIRDPFLEVFNQPSPEFSCEQRDSSNVTPQVFSLLNSKETQDRSVAFAASIISQLSDEKPESWIALAIESVLGRQPSEAEIQLFTSHYRTMLKKHETADLEPVVYPTSVKRDAIDEVTGVPFEFEEELFVFSEYQPDQSFADSTPQVRALSDVCLVLFNSNEFAYLY